MLREPAYSHIPMIKVLDTQMEKIRGSVSSFAVKYAKPVDFWGY